MFAGFSEQAYNARDAAPFTKDGVMNTIDLSAYGITVRDIRQNLQPASLYAEAVQRDAKAAIAKGGALIAYSGAKTGRSPNDRRVVRSPASEADIWWGEINIAIPNETYQINRERAIDYLNTL